MLTTENKENMNYNYVVYDITTDKPIAFANKFDDLNVLDEFTDVPASNRTLYATGSEVLKPYFKKHPKERDLYYKQHKNDNIR